MAKKKKISRKQRIDCTSNEVYNPSVNFPEIKRRREAKKMTQTDAAKKAGWPTQQQWASIESGSRPNPRVNTMATVARVLGCKVDDLLVKR